MISRNPEKNIELMLERGVSFEEILSSLEQGGLLTVLDHPNRWTYPNQQIWVAKLRDYAHLVSLARPKDKLFSKTIMPSRAATKLHLLEVSDEE